MNKDETNKTENTSKPTPMPNLGIKKVTSDATIDFSLGWGIHAGEIRELPADEESQKVILSNHHITLIK